uniref:protein FAM204A isoform X2 n=1 Tax=Myxine glutinosa TaxID=7769 RepID=UPI00358FC339
MYSGLLPPGLSESDLEKDDHEEEEELDCVREDKESHLVTGVSTSLGDEDQGSTEQKFEELQQRNQNISNAWSRRRALDLKRRRKKKRMTKSNLVLLYGDDGKVQEESKTNEEMEEDHGASGADAKRSDYDHRWNELRQFFNANRNVDRPACNRPLPPGKLEKNMEMAVVAGDVDTAQELSDQLATRQFGVMVARAVDCRTFMKEQRSAAQAPAQRQRRSRLTWGFEAKKRWETKSNMGYM